MKVSDAEGHSICRELEFGSLASVKHDGRVTAVSINDTRTLSLIQGRHYGTTQCLRTLCTRTSLPTVGRVRTHGRPSAQSTPSRRRQCEEDQSDRQTPRYIARPSKQPTADKLIATNMDVNADPRWINMYFDMHELGKWPNCLQAETATLLNVIIVVIHCETRVRVSE